MPNITIIPAQEFASIIAPRLSSANNRVALNETSARSLYMTSASTHNPNTADRNSIASTRNPSVMAHHSMCKQDIQDRSPHNPSASPQHANALQHNLNAEHHIRMLSIDNAFAINNHSIVPKSLALDKTILLHFAQR